MPAGRHGSHATGGGTSPAYPGMFRSRAQRHVDGTMRPMEDVPSVAALEGLPADYIARHQPGENAADGPVALTVKRTGTPFTGVPSGSRTVRRPASSQSLMCLPLRFSCGPLPQISTWSLRSVARLAMSCPLSTETIQPPLLAVVANATAAWQLVPPVAGLA